ncbi:MAG TPA: type II toxin-antitoxin system prevent-host-death family antitoxin [Bryobacteraceae bacterium]|nr:type II toxin-antitoxin system prevent-host-death family antitoxin [Bryobacteraceae bacterium]
MPTTVNMHKAKSSLSKLVKRASAGEEIVIASRGKPVAMLTRLPRRADFDAPLDDFSVYCG